MGNNSILLKLLYLNFVFMRITADSLSLNYNYTAVETENHLSLFTVVLVDKLKTVSYDNNNKMMVLIPQWIKNKIGSDDWKKEVDYIDNEQDHFKTLFNTLKRLISGKSTLQWMYGCEQHDDGAARGYERYSYGKSVIDLDLKTLTWTTSSVEWKAVTDELEHNINKNARKEYLENDCIEKLQLRYMKHLRKVPEVEMFQQKTSPDVECIAKGFFPRGVMMSWQKDGETMVKDVELTETLPIQDGTFQKKIILKVSSEDLQKHNYTCVIQHSSLKKDLVLTASQRQTLNSGGSSKESTAIILGSVMNVFLFLLLL